MRQPVLVNNLPYLSITLPQRLIIYALQQCLHLFQKQEFGHQLMTMVRTKQGQGAFMEMLLEPTLEHWLLWVPNLQFVEITVA